jgi:hypothetical protein
MKNNHYIYTMITKLIRSHIIKLKNHKCLYIIQYILKVFKGY